MRELNDNLMGDDSLMELKKNVSYQIQDERHSYTLTPKDIQTTNIEEQETLIKKFFETFNIAISNIPFQQQPSEPPKQLKLARKMRNSVLDVWSNVKQYLQDEFTADEYWDASKKAGYEYKDTTKQAIPYQHLNKLAKIQKVERIDVNPVKWRKVYLKTSEEGAQRMIESLKEAKKVELGVLK